MPGKHGMTKNKEGMPKNYKGAPKLSEKQAKHIDTNKDGKISGADFPINRMRNTKETDATAKGMPKNYNGMTKNFAMKNKMLSDSAKNGIPMQKNYSGMPKITGSTQEKTENKKSTDKVVDPDTSVVTDVATQRLIKAGAPKEVIEKAKADFIAREKSKKK
jgi:hypothetical protein